MNSIAPLLPLILLRKILYIYIYIYIYIYNYTYYLPSVVHDEVFKAEHCNCHNVYITLK